MKTFQNICLICLLSIGSLSAKNKDFQKYIQTYSAIAMSEMERTGVPASIKLAQGLLESNAGRSDLAVKAKNHFGIKCGSKWKGKTYKKRDDDYKNGRLVKSCFRKYKSVEASFYAHSEFLLANKRYRSLFQIAPTDYKKWAKGLKKAGYATSKTYDKKLIKLIEEYALFQFDHQTSADLVARPITSSKVFSEVKTINDAKMIFAKVGDTPRSIADRTKTSWKRILSYNENISTPNQVLVEQEIVFLQKKRKNYRGKQRKHKVEAGQTMYDIAQLYGLRLSYLYGKNKMRQGTQPAAGALIYIRGKAKKTPALKKLPSEIPPSPVLIDENTKVKVDSTIIETEQDTTSPSLNEPVIAEIEPIDELEDQLTPVITSSNKEPKYHSVSKGETLWRIAKNYGISVEQLKKMNLLTNNIIGIGQRLRVR